MRVSINFDLRNPMKWHRPTEQVYRETLEMIEYADSVGIDVISVSVHHRWDDGYISQPLTWLAAAAARTNQARLMTGVMLLPLYDPVHVAEQATVVDYLSGGRLELAFGAGYRRPEFEIFGLDMADRYRRFEHNVRSIREVWADERFQPSPPPKSIPLWAGLMGPKAARLAGRLGMRLYTLSPKAWGPYLEGWNSEPGLAGTPSLGGTLAMMLVDDPEQAAAELGDLIVDHFTTYDRYAMEGIPAPPPEVFTAAQRLALGAFPRAPATPDGAETTGGTGTLPATPPSWPKMGCSLLRPAEAAEQILRLAAGRPVDVVKLWATVGSNAGDLAFRNIELIATQLKPLLNAVTQTEDVEN